MGHICICILFMYSCVRFYSYTVVTLWQYRYCWIVYCVQVNRDRFLLTWGGPYGSYVSGSITTHWVHYPRLLWCMFLTYKYSFLEKSLTLPPKTQIDYNRYNNNKISTECGSGYLCLCLFFSF